jgi:stage IV sporulation protein FA
MHSVAFFCSIKENTIINLSGDIMKTKNKMYKFLTKSMFLCLIILGTLIIFKANPTLKSTIYQKVFNEHFDFAKINEWYEKKFGSVLPETKTKEEAVFNETIEYSDIKDYKDGAKLTVSKDYSVPATESGIVIFSGEKEGYGNTVIIQRSDGIDVWYGNLKDINVSLYDYVKKNTIIGSANGTMLIMAFQKDGDFIDYKKNI